MHEQEADAEAKRRWGAKAGVRRVPNAELLDADYLVAAEILVSSAIEAINLSKPHGRSTKSWEDAFRKADEEEGKKLSALDLALPHLRAACDQITANYPDEPYAVYDPQEPSPSNVYRIVLDALTRLEYLQLKERGKCPE